MKTQRKYLRKTHHFLLRAWERGYYHSSIEKISSKLRPVKMKTFYLIDRKKLKELSVSKTKSNYLAILVKEDCLITLFELSDLWEFMRRNSEYKFISIN